VVVDEDGNVVEVVAIERVKPVLEVLEDDGVVEEEDIEEEEEEENISDDDADDE
ncbi:MAG: DNA gyrase subunit A, partial [Flavobacteriales bacterium]